ncbi:MAG: FG-GAP repeat protein [Xanthomonadaceae bacterium]|nr:FG-GAP repeat protein [Xanthomonadaceae bacterium]
MKIYFVPQLLAVAMMMAGCQQAPATGKADSVSGQAQGRVMDNAAPPSTTSSSPASTTANATLDAQGHMALSLGDWSLQVSATDCEQWLDHVQWCKRDVRLEIAGPEDVNQTLSLEKIYLDSEATAYLGSLSGGYREKGYSIVLGDLNGDDHPDLMVWTGREGGYGGASYDVFLFDAKTREFVRNPALTELMQGATAPFLVEDGYLKLAFKDGCCLHVFDSYQLRNGEPVLVERVTEDNRSEKNQEP